MSSFDVDAGESQVKVQRDYAKKGPRPAVISGIIDMGIQPQEYQGEVKTPCVEFKVLLTLAQDTYTDDEGVVHNMVTSPWPIAIKTNSEKSNFMKFSKAVDPDEKVIKNGKGKMFDLIGLKCYAVMEHNVVGGITYANCAGIQEIPEDTILPEFEYKEVRFSISDPDEEVLNSLYERDQVKIRASVSYKANSSKGDNALVDPEEDLPY